MSNRALTQLASLIFFFTILCVPFYAYDLNSDKHGSESFRPVVKKYQRKPIVVSDFGVISAVKVPDVIRGAASYHMQFITLESSSLFLPAILHSDMVIYVDTGSGRLSWADYKREEIKRVTLKRGDIYRLHPGSVFQIQSNGLENEIEKLRIYAIFTNPDDESHLDPSIGAYSSIADVVRGFDKKILQSAFKAPEEVIEAITNSAERQIIIHANPTKEENLMEWESRFLKAFMGGKDSILYSNKKKTRNPLNIFEEEPGFKNCYGWSTTVTKKTTHLLKGSNVAIFMVNLTKGSMMGPHWNPKATEIAIVLQGHGMIRVVSANINNQAGSKNMRFRVSEGDVFTVPKNHPMAQMSFNNETLVFMGFSTSTGKNHPQFLAGKKSILQTLDKNVLALSLNATNSTIDQLLNSKADSIILECTSCAEEEEMNMKEEEERSKEEEGEERERREEEEERRRQEEAERRKREDYEQQREEEDEDGEGKYM